MDSDVAINFQISQLKQFTNSGEVKYFASISPDMKKQHSKKLIFHKGRYTVQEAKKYKRSNLSHHKVCRQISTFCTTELDRQSANLVRKTWSCLKTAHINDKILLQ
uniref:Uncharacterized protein n=1 Tax=Triticum urartu TaxID=4572 RepID=A0A8R7UYE2_TRIUA